MASTRMRLNTSAQVFHRIAAANDMAAHDVGTTDSAVSGLGGTTDFELEADSDVTYATSHQVVDTTEAAIGSAAIADFIHIKNTGFTSSAKSTAVTDDELKEVRETLITQLNQYQTMAVKASGALEVLSQLISEDDSEDDG
jgi:hypothetical protein